MEASLEDVLDTPFPCEVCHEDMTMRDPDAVIREIQVPCPQCVTVHAGYNVWHIGCVVEELMQRSAGIRASIAVELMRRKAEKN